MTVETIPGQPAPLAWIVEPKDGKTAPYLTQKPNVATKREKAGDFVTPYISQFHKDDEV